MARYVYEQISIVGHGIAEGEAKTGMLQLIHPELFDVKSKSLK